MHPAQAQGRQAVHLGEGARDHHVVGTGPGRLGDQIVAGGVAVILLQVLRVSGVDHKQNTGRQGSPQAPEFGRRNPGAGGVARVGHAHHPRPLRDARRERVHVGGEVGFRREHRHRPDPAGGDAIDDEAMLGLQHLVAGIGIQPDQMAQQLFGATADDDAVRVQIVRRADGRAQVHRGRIGIALQIPQAGPDRLDRLGAGTQRAFVGCQLDDLGVARDFGIAGLVGRDVEHARARLRAVGDLWLVVHQRRSFKQACSVPPSGLWCRRSTGRRHRASRCAPGRRNA